MAEGARVLDKRRLGPDGWLSDGGYWDPQLGGRIIKVLPGEHRMSRKDDEILVTVLGSCVAACIRDPVTRVGGMNHFMLPGEARGTWGGASHEMRYGQYAMERLINEVLTAGGRFERLEVKLFGGANVTQSSIRVGDRNVEFVREFLRQERLSIAAEDLGGSNPRRVHYFATTGRVMRKELRRSDDIEVFAREEDYRQTLRHAPVEGTIELFD